MNYSRTFPLIIRKGTRQYLLLGVTLGLLSVSALAQSPAAKNTTGNVDGVVVDAASQPISRATIVLADKSKSVRIETTTKQDGSFAFSSVPLGTYILTAVKPGFRNTNPETPVSLSSGEQQHLRLTLQNLATDGSPEKSTAQATAAGSGSFVSRSTS